MFLNKVLSKQLERFWLTVTSAGVERTGHQGCREGVMEDASELHYGNYRIFLGAWPTLSTKSHNIMASAALIFNLSLISPPALLDFKGQQFTENGGIKKNCWVSDRVKTPHSKGKGTNSFSKNVDPAWKTKGSYGRLPPMTGFNWSKLIWAMSKQTTTYSLRNKNK